VAHTSASGRRAAVERDLRLLLRFEPGLTVVTGGQTGVDTFAALAALRAGLAAHLVFPRGYRQEDGQLTTERRGQVCGAVLHELNSASFRYRTWTCAYLADVIVLLDPAGGAGCRETARAARKLGRPLLSPGPGELISADVAGWLARTGARVLMVAGCRGSLLASRREERAVQSDLAVLMAGARRQHASMRDSGSRPEPA
jgi:Circularly permutated YpsA SLOG family